MIVFPVHFSTAIAGFCSSPWVEAIPPEAHRLTVRNNGKCNDLIRPPGDPLDHTVHVLSAACSGEYTPEHQVQCSRADKAEIFGLHSLLSLVDLSPSRNLPCSPNDGLPVTHRPDHLPLPNSRE